MSAYKDKAGKWYVQFNYRNWKGETKHTCKRGFNTKKEALEWETQFKLEKANSTDMLFSEFVERYKKDMYPRIKVSTVETKDSVIDKHITPYFGKKKLAEITTTDVIKWQNEMMAFRKPNGKPFSKSYLKKLHNEFSAILNFAVRYLGLKNNPAGIVGNMGTDKEIKLNFWTREEYMKFREEVMENVLAYYCFEVLYWTGMREGELLALTLDDIDFENRTISISKTFHHINGQDIITTPKTLKSNRVISIPNFLAEELIDYVAMCYDVDPKERLFPCDKSFLSRKLHMYGDKAGLKRIRVHDLRHSHVSLLIDMGYSAVAIAERVGHESVEITYRYAHMFPSVQVDMATKLDEQMEEKGNV